MIFHDEDENDLMDEDTERFLDNLSIWVPFLALVYITLGILGVLR